MTDVSAYPNIKAFEVPIDTYAQPFWDGTKEGKLVFPRCGNCGLFRWPPGPFCSACQSQHIDWQPAGVGRVYSFTIVNGPAPAETASPPVLAPALIEFPDAGGIRLVAAIVDTPVSEIRIGAKVDVAWSQAANAAVPVFKIAKT